MRKANKVKEMGRNEDFKGVQMPQRKEKDSPPKNNPKTTYPSEARPCTGKTSVNNTQRAHTHTEASRGQSGNPSTSAPSLPLPKPTQISKRSKTIPNQTNSDEGTSEGGLRRPR